jgi:hypothetical protein
MKNHNRIKVIVLSLILSGCSFNSYHPPLSGEGKACVNQCAQQKNACQQADTNGAVGPAMESHQLKREDRPNNPGLLCQKEYNQCYKVCGGVIN